MNSKTNKENSFRSPWIPPELSTSTQTATWESEYYELTRGDLEYEINVEGKVTLWKKAAVALVYREHERYSNMDDALKAPSAATVKYGYRQNVIMLELRQLF